MTIHHHNHLFFQHYLRRDKLRPGLHREWKGSRLRGSGEGISTSGEGISTIDLHSTEYEKSIQEHTRAYKSIQEHTRRAYKSVR
jgi:hypothetical protein